MIRIRKSKMVGHSWSSTRTKPSFDLSSYFVIRIPVMQCCSNHRRKLFSVCNTCYRSTKTNAHFIASRTFPFFDSLDKAFLMFFGPSFSFLSFAHGVKCSLVVAVLQALIPRDTPVTGLSSNGQVSESMSRGFKIFYPSNFCAVQVFFFDYLKNFPPHLVVRTDDIFYPAVDWPVFLKRSMMTVLVWPVSSLFGLTDIPYLTSVIIRGIKAVNEISWAVSNSLFKCH